LNTHGLVAKSAVFKALRNVDATTCGNGHQSSVQPPRTYLQLGWPLFPVNARTRAPLIEGGFYGATTDEATIVDWLQRWPRALLATPTGRAIGRARRDGTIPFHCGILVHFWCIFCGGSTPR